MSARATSRHSCWMSVSVGVRARGAGRGGATGSTELCRRAALLPGELTELRLSSELAYAMLSCTRTGVWRAKSSDALLSKLSLRVATAASRTGDADRAPITPIACRNIASWCATAGVWTMGAVCAWTGGRNGCDSAALNRCVSRARCARRSPSVSFRCAASRCRCNSACSSWAL